MALPTVDSFTILFIVSLEIRYFETSSPRVPKPVTREDEDFLSYQVDNCFQLASHLLWGKQCCCFSVLKTLLDYIFCWIGLDAPALVRQRTQTDGDVYSLC